MKATQRSIIAVVVAAAVAIVLVAKLSGSGGEPANPTATAPASAPGLPTMVDLGARHCIPCKMMEEVMAELRRDYAGKLSVEFIDVNARPDAANRYGVRVIPTQVFLDAEGSEFFRHEGYFSTQEVLAALRAHGYAM